MANYNYFLRGCVEMIFFLLHKYTAVILCVAGGGDDQKYIGVPPFLVAFGYRQMPEPMPLKGLQKCLGHRQWSSCTANSDKKYMEVNRAALNVNKPCVTSRKTAFPEDK